MMIEQALKQLDPVPDLLAGHDAARATADLEHILALPREAVPSRSKPRHAHGRRLAVIGIASCIALALVVGLPLLPWRAAQPAVAATPPLLSGQLAPGVTGPAVADELGRIAAEAVRSDLPGRLGGSHAAWDLATRVHGGEPVRSAVVPLEVSLEVRADGSWRRLASYGQPVAGDLDATDLPAHGEVESDEVYPADLAPRIFPERLAEDESGLREQLAQAHPIDQLGTAELFVALTDLAKEQTPTPAARAALLGLLAEPDDVRALGAMTDRDGRPGRAFAVDSELSGLPTRYVLIVDPLTGRVLASEQILTERAGKLAVEVPAVVSYAVFR
ncbi:hypothetical protein [Intrasporangium sp.]|uniref:hypothetical protein n=1 Tax=Intrasporangium sp. TaxID=1925024 RepID=UPI002939B4A4|nr:hypothetical protein [Intrasporangium sp.]MDV3220438.1 hypothetical protein [Intrasporangium sp.]